MDPTVPGTSSCGPFIESGPIAEKSSAAFDAFRGKTKAIGKKVSEEFGRVSWALRPSTEGSEREREAERVKIARICGGWLGEPVPQSEDHEPRGDCLVEFQLGGAAAVIEYTSECSSDSCSTSSYVWLRDESAPVEVDQPAEFVNIAPGGEYVYYSAAGQAPVDRYTYRSRLDGSDRCVITDACFSPRLSPDGWSLLCRTFDADVLKVSANGGAPEVLATAGLSGGQVVYVRRQWGEYPQPVEFVDERQIEYDVTYEEEARAASQPQTKQMTLGLP